MLSFSSSNVQLSSTTTTAVRQLPEDIAEPGHDSDQVSASSCESSESDMLSSDSAFQPAVNIIPSQYLGHVKTRILHFQQGWFQKFKWLHYLSSLQDVLCFTCAKAEKLNMIDLATKRDPAFITNGFRNWKKALEIFQSHHSSQCHNFCYMQLQRINQSQPAVNTQLSSQLQAEQGKAAVNIVKQLCAVFSSSLTCRSAFARITAENEKIHKIKPLCPTRWLVLVDAIRALVTQYREVLDTLEEVAGSKNTVSTKASGLHSRANQQHC